MLLQVVTSLDRPTDFCQDYLAARYFWDGMPTYSPVHCWKGVIYDPVTVEYNSHPPASVLFFLPFGLLPRLQANLLFGLLSLLSYLAAGVLLLRELGWFSWRGVTLFLLGSLFWQPFTLSEQLLNFSQVLLVLLAVAWLLERRGHPRAAGIVLGIASLLKIWPGLLLVGAAITQRWRLALAGVGTIVAGGLVSLLIFGSSSYATYLWVIAPNERVWLPGGGNVSLVGAITRPFVGYGDILPIVPNWGALSLHQAVLLGEGVAGVLLALLLGLIWRWWSKHGASWLVVQALLLTASLLLFPLTWAHGLLLLVFVGALLVLAVREAAVPRWWRTLLAGSLLPLVEPGWTLALPLWVQASPAWAQLLIALPTVGLLGLLALLAYLLYASKQGQLQHSGAGLDCPSQTSF
jgi:hypothetical protein